MATAASLTVALENGRNSALRVESKFVVGGTRKAIRRNVLMIVEVAVCTLVLVGMGLCERSLYNLRHLNPGFSAQYRGRGDVFAGGRLLGFTRELEMGGPTQP